MKDDKIPSIQNLRIFLTALVVLHHLACTYGGPRIWYYQENTSNFALFTLLTVFIAVNQSFFMGLFFLISAYFTPKSLQTKGFAKYIKDRLIRLGIPLTLFFLVLSPITAFMGWDSLRHGSVSLWEYLLSFQGISFGPLWFIEALLLFCMVYAVVYLIGNSRFGRKPIQMQLPSDAMLIVYAVITGVLSFIVRLWFPVGWVLQPFAFQLSHFVQYILLFAVGTIAYHNQWLSSISLKRAVRWLIFAHVMIFVVTPAILLLGGALSGSLKPFYGGPYWQSLAYSLWEQLVGFALIVGLLGLFYHRDKHLSKWSVDLANSTYALFVIHAPIIVGLCVSIRTVQLDPFYKFIILGPISLVVGFSIAVLLRKIPLVSKVM